MGEAAGKLLGVLFLIAVVILIAVAAIPGTHAVASHGEWANTARDMINNCSPDNFGVAYSPIRDANMQFCWEPETGHVAVQIFSADGGYREITCFVGRSIKWFVKVLVRDQYQKTGSIGWKLLEQILLERPGIW